MVSAKWSQSGHQEVVNLGFLLVSQILRKLQQKPDLKLSKPLNINRRPPPTHLSGPGLPKGTLFFFSTKVE